MTTRTNIWWIVDVDADDASIREAIAVIPQRLVEGGFAPDDRRPFEAWQAAADVRSHDEGMASTWAAIQAEVLKRVEAHCPALMSPASTQAEVVPKELVFSRR